MQGYIRSQSPLGIFVVCQQSVIANVCVYGFIFGLNESPCTKLQGTKIV
jgi:hypothetical protein